MFPARLFHVVSERKETPMKKYRSTGLLRALSVEDVDDLTAEELVVLFDELGGKEGEDVRDLLEKAIETINDPSIDERRRSRFNRPFLGNLRRYNKKSKRGRLIQLLLVKGGATMAECMAINRWGYRECYNEISMVHLYTGFGLVEGKDRKIRAVTTL